MVTVRLEKGDKITLPKALKESLGVKEGEEIRLYAFGKDVAINPEEEEMTPEEEAAVLEALEDIKAGRVFGPFKNAKEMIRALDEASLEDDGES